MIERIVSDALAFMGRSVRSALTPNPMTVIA
jgi:hypothetical protein